METKQRRSNMNTVKMPAFVRDPRSKKEAYVSVDDLRNDRTLAMHAIDAELGKLVFEIRRVRQLATALGVPERVDDILDLASRRVVRAGTPPR
jgi:hypothetical protein